MSGKRCACDMCSKQSKFYDMTAIGLRHFCSEKCWAQYTGVEVKPEGHYGMLHKTVGWWE
jgi:hypothetical protein